MTFKDKMINWFKKNKVDLIIYFGFLLILILLITLAVAPGYKNAIANNTPYSSIAIRIKFWKIDLEIAWYAIFILSGIILAATMAIFEFKRANWKTDDLLDGVLIIAPLAIIGARLYYVLFDQPDSFVDIFKIWKGGLAIHGAIIVATIGVIIFSKKKKLNVSILADILALGFLMGQITGRWGNFMNAEAHGGETSSKFLINILPKFIEHQMGFSSYDMLGPGLIFQPTFLYESLWNLLGLTILFIVRRKKWFKAGDMLGFYLIWYGFGRGVLVEPFRTDQLKAFGIPINILMSLVLFIGGGILYLILKRVYVKEEPYYVDLVSPELEICTKKKKDVVKNESNTI